MKARYIVDEDGEVLRELNETDRILSRSNVEFLEKTDVIRFNFGKSNVDAYELVSETNLKYAVLLQKYVELGTGILKYKNGLTIDTAIKIGRIFKMEKKSSQHMVRRLISEDIIHRHSDKIGTYYTYNPYIFHVGRRLSKDLIEEFQESKWREQTYENKARQKNKYE